MDDESDLAQLALTACGVDGVVASLERLSGKSHLSWRVTRIDAAPVVLRMEPRRGILPPYDLPSEARLLRCLTDAGIPVPEVLGVAADLSACDGLDHSVDVRRGCMVVEWVNGEVLSERRMETDIARAYCETLRRIHTLNWREARVDWLPLPPASGPAMRERTQIAERLRAFGIDDLPHIKRLREALHGRVPDSPPPMLVHGDVNFGNFILQVNDGASASPSIAAVLDWEQAHLGDSLSDWGRLAAEDLLGNLNLSEGARQVMQEALQSYGRSQDDLSYWTLHQLYKHASATGALSVIHGWDIEPIAEMYAGPTDQAASRLEAE